MRFKVTFRKEARDEAVEAAAYIAEEGSPEASARWLEGLERAIESLSIMPRRCRRAREQPAFPDRELRQLRYKSHRLIFTILGREVHVLHIWHAARRDMNDQAPGNE